MPKNGPFPRKEGELNTYFAIAVPYIGSNAPRLKVSAANVTAATTQLGVWNTTYPLTQNPDTATTTANDNKNAARDALMGTLRTIYADIPESVLTAQDRNTLNLTERSTTRTPAAVPSTKPAGTVDTSKRLQHTINFYDSEGTGIAKPAGVRGCQIWLKIGSPAPTDPKELDFLATDTKTPYTHDFDGTDASKMVYYWLRWENTRGETGPWSEPIQATVVG
jgi:hypothetical protein